MQSPSSLPACVLAFLGGLVLGDFCVEVFRLRLCLSVHGFLSGGASSSILTVSRHFLQEFLVFGTSYNGRSFL